MHSDGGSIDDPGPACPYLGLDDDPNTRCLYPSPAHRCFAGERPIHIGVEHQSSCCLSEDYPSCRWEEVEQTPVRIRRPASPIRGWSRSVRRGGRVQLRALALDVGAGLAAIILVGFLLSQAWGAITSGGRGVAAATPPAGDAAYSSLPASTPAAGPSPVPTRAPASTATAAPTAAPTVGPTATRTAGRVYVVQAGDTLWLIASRNGVTVDELMKANDLTDRDFIWSGQRLTIP